MNYEPYTLHVTEHDRCFSFQSIGRNGTVDKVIYFSPNGEDMFNLGLVDVDPITGKKSDKSVTNNGDLPEVMATVVTAMLLFLESYPDQAVQFKGSTELRSRLFENHIAQIYPHLMKDLTVLGLQNNRWDYFEVGVQYESFMVSKKELNLVFRTGHLNENIGKKNH